MEFLKSKRGSIVQYLLSLCIICIVILAVLRYFGITIDIVPYIKGGIEDFVNILNALIN